MQTVYQTSDYVEAHMLLAMLEQSRLDVQITGQHLQGAMGEVPAVGYIRLLVAEEDVALATKLIEEWEANQPLIEPERKSAVEIEKARFNSGFIMGLVTGVIITLIMFGI